MQGHSKVEAVRAACPHWLWRALLIWLPQPHLLRAMSAYFCCMRGLRTIGMLCNCGSWPLCRSEQGKHDSRPRTVVQSARGPGTVELVHYTILEVSPADVNPMAAITRSSEVTEAPERSPVPQLSTRVPASRSRSGSPTDQTSPSSHPRLFTPSIKYKHMEEPRRAILYQQSQHKCARLPPVRSGDESQQCSTEMSNSSHATRCATSLPHSSNAHAAVATARDPSPEAVCSKVQFALQHL